jgi:hypothetical protein
MTPEARLDAYIDRLRPNYEGFLKKLAQEFLGASGRYVTDWARRDLALHLDSVVSAFLEWQRMRQCVRDARLLWPYQGIPLEEDEDLLLLAMDAAASGDAMYQPLFTLGVEPVNEERVRELIGWYFNFESDVDVFVAMCKQIESDLNHLAAACFADVDDDYDDEKTYS